MGFHEVSLPDHLARGAAGGPGHSTEVTQLLSGYEQRVARWADSRRRYSVGYRLRGPQDLADLQAFVLARQGALHGFRFKDWADYSSDATGMGTPAADDQEIGTGDALETVFQLVKVYTSGGESITRTITKPVDGTVLVAVDGVTKTEGVDYTVNYTTGQVTFGTAPPGGDAVTAGFQFEVPVRFGQDVDQIFQVSIEVFEHGSIPGIELVELKDATAEAFDNFIYGGGRYLEFSSDISISLGEGRAQTLKPTLGGLSVLLPAAGGAPKGGPYFFIRNDGGVAFTLKDSAGGAVATINAADQVEVWLGENVSGSRIWYVAG